MRVTEPMTMLTDYALALLGVWFGWRLVGGGRHGGERSRMLWGVSFLLMALAAAAGGTAHGFAAWLGGVEGSWLWKLATFSVGLASAALLAAAVVARLAVYLAWMSVHDDFRFVVYDYAPSMLAVVLLLALPGRSGPLEGAGWVTAGVAVSFAAAAVQRSGFSLHRHLNHNDLYHLIQMAGMYLLYRGGVQLRDRRERGG